MNVNYAVTMYQITLTKEEVDTDILKSLMSSDRKDWTQIDRIDFINMSNARLSFEGRRQMAALCKISETEYDVTFFTLSEEQITEKGETTRIEIIDIAAPKGEKRL